MEAASAAVREEEAGSVGVPHWAAYAPPCAPPEPCTRDELRAVVLGAVGDRTEAEACEKLLATSAHVAAALELAIGDGLAALCVGDRLIRLGFSNLATCGGRGSSR